MMSYDGDVTLSVNLEPGDVKSTADTLRKDIDNIFKTNSGKELSASFKSMQNSMEKSHKKAGQLLQRLEELENTSIPTKDFEELDKQYEKLLGQLGTLTERKDRFLNTGGRTGSKTFVRMEYDIDKVNEKINETLQQMNQLRKEGGAAVLGEDTQEYSELVAQLNEVNNQMTIYKQRALESKDLAPDTSKWEGFKQSISTVGPILSKITHILHGIVSSAGAVVSKLLEIARAAGRAAGNLAKMAGRSIVRGISSLIGHLGKLTSSLRRTHKSTDSVSDVFKKGLRTLMRYGLGVRSLYFLMRKLRKALGEGIGNLAQYSPAFNNVISNFISALTQLKNSFATAFAPIINVVAPIITTFINLMSAAVTRIGMLIAALTGRNTFIRAKAVQEDFASSLDGAAGSAGRATKAAEKYKKTIAGFDDVEILKGPDDGSSSGGGSGGSGGGGGVDPADMFETVEIPDVIQDWADKLKDAWAEADFSGIGEILGIKLVEGLNSIPWDSIQETSSTFGSSFATFINGLIEVDELGNTIGKTIGEAINTALIAWESFLGDDEKGFHFDSLGTFIADAMNEVLDTTYWNKLADNIVKTANGIFTAAGTWADKFKFDKLGNELGKGVKRIFNNFDFSIFEWNLTNFGTGLADFVTGFFEESPMTAVGDAFGDAVDAILVGTNSFLNNLPTETIATDFADAMNKIFENKQLWTDLATTISSTANSIFSLASTWSSKFKFGQMGSSIRTAITNTLNKLSWNDAETAVGNIATGIATALNNIMTADTFESVGTAIGNGINLAVTGIHNFVSGISWDNWATNLGRGINTFFNTINWEKLHITFTTVTTALANAINAAFNTLKTITLNIKWDDWGKAVGDSVNNFFKTIKWEEVGATFSDVVKGVIKGLKAELETIDFVTIGNDLAVALGNVKWADLIAEAAKLVNTIGEDWADFVDGFFSGLVDALNTWLESKFPPEILAVWKFLTKPQFEIDEEEAFKQLNSGNTGGPSDHSTSTRIPVVLSAEQLEDNIPDEQKVVSDGDIYVTSMDDKILSAKELDDGRIRIETMKDGILTVDKIIDGVTGKVINVKDAVKPELKVLDEGKLRLKRMDETGLPGDQRVVNSGKISVTTATYGSMAPEQKKVTGGQIQFSTTDSTKLPADQRKVDGLQAIFANWARAATWNAVVDNMEAKFFSWSTGNSSDGWTYIIDGMKAKFFTWSKGSSNDGWTNLIDGMKARFIDWSKGSSKDGWTNVIDGMKAKFFNWSKGKKADGWSNLIDGMKAKFIDWSKGKSTEGWSNTVGNMEAQFKKWIPGDKWKDNAVLSAILSTWTSGSKWKDTATLSAILSEWSRGRRWDEEVGGMIAIFKDWDKGKSWSDNITGMVASLSKLIFGGKATGGAYYNGAWHNIAQYAVGGRPRYGTVFAAGEAGPEVVGHVGGRTEVLNQSQLASTMYSAVVNGSVKAMNAVLSHMTTCFNSVNANLGYLLNVNTADLMLIQKIDSALNSLDNKMTAVVTGNTVPNSFMVNNSNDLINTLKTMNNMLQYNQDNMVSKDDLADILATMFRQYMNITFYMGDEEVARHANAGNARLNYRFNPVAR